MSGTDPRGDLAAAIAERDHAAAKAADAAAAAGRAAGLVTQAEAHLRTFSALDNRIAQHRADAIRAGSASLPGLPADLAEEKLARDDATAAVEEARAVLALLSGEAKAAQAAAEAAAHDVNLAALAVASGDIEAAGRRLIDIEAEAATLRTSLHAAARHQIVSDAGRAGFAFSRDVSWALQTTPRNASVETGNGPQGPAFLAHKATWARYFDALTKNPMATFEAAA